MKIALNVICKGTDDEAKQMYRMLSSAAPYVDAIYVTTTWKESGKTPDIIKTFGGHLSHFQWVKDFSKARNFAMSQIPDEYEYVLWLDTDDELLGGMALKDIIKSGMDAYFAEYQYQIDEKTGDILISHPRERILRKNVYEWVAALHETALAKISNPKTTFTRQIAVAHHPTKENIDSNIKRNIEILEKAYEEEKEHDPRTEYYLARCYFDEKNFDKAKKLFLDYLEHSGWDEERAMAWNYLGEIRRDALEYDEAIDCYLQAVKERPEFPTWYINIGLVYAKKEDWDRAIFYTKMGLGLEQPKTAMVLTPRDDKMRALETLYFACLGQNKIKEAFAAAEQLCQLFPDDEFLAKRRDGVYQIHQLGELGKHVIAIVEELTENGEEDKVEALLTGLPGTLTDTLLVEKLRKQFTPAKVWPEKSIVYYCGKGFEKWDETNLEKGIGGSETAVINLSKEWVKRGYQVTIYGDPHTEHETDGVTWLPYWKWNPKDSFDTLIIWRNESVLNLPLQAKRILLDLHDVPEPAQYTEERLKKITKIFVKSKYHRSLLPDVPDEKFAIVPNGIDLSLIPKKVEKKGIKVVWASSYDRGLEQALSIGWPIIKKAVPDAEFHIFYGWNLFDRIFSANPERQAWKKKIELLMEQPGVFHHGRVSQKELIDFKAESLVHFYPTTFEEIDCISVRESAAVGCIPFTTSYAALEGREYCDTTEGDPNGKETQEAIARKVAEFIKNDGIHQLDPYKAKEENWGNISQVWLKSV